MTTATPIKAIETRYKPVRGKTPADHTGRRFGRLIALACVGRRASESRPTSGGAVWLCRCDCGTETSVIAASLVDGSTRSCGCLFLENARSHGGRNILGLGESAFNQYFGSYKRSAQLRGYSFTLTPEEFRELTSQDCYYCLGPPSTKFHAARGTNGDFVGNGVDRIDNRKGYERGNVRSCCKQCNIAKGTLSEDEFYAWSDRLTAARQARFEFGR